VTTSLKQRLDAGQTMLLDGAVGTELDRRGVSTRLPLWSALGLTDAPDVVREIHADYVRAGADVLIANTFRTTRRTFAKDETRKVDLPHLNALAIELARSAARDLGRDVLVAGSIAPLEDCYSPWLSPSFDVALAEHREQAGWLKESGADLLMVETMPLIAEAEAAVTAARETGLEVTVGFVVGSDGRLLSGESLADAVARVTTLGVVAILINCSSPSDVHRSICRLTELTDLPVGGYANLGRVDPVVGWEADASIDGDAYAWSVADWMRSGARIVGGCCGTRPEQIAAVRRVIDEWDDARQ